MIKLYNAALPPSSLSLKKAASSPVPNISHSVKVAVVAKIKLAMKILIISFNTEYLSFFSSVYIKAGNQLLISLFDISNVPGDSF